MSTTAATEPLPKRQKMADSPPVIGTHKARSHADEASPSTSSARALPQ
jgi:hypothetical protein